MALLQPYTPRPTAHFRELCDAERLLTLQQDRVRCTDALCSWTALLHGVRYLHRSTGPRTSEQRYKPRYMPPM